LTILLDPTAERSPTVRPRLARPDRLEGLAIGVLDIAKPTNTRPAPLALRQQIATEVDLVVEGLSD
jgi:hypothetical protein